MSTILVVMIGLLLAAGVIAMVRLRRQRTGRRHSLALLGATEQGDLEEMQALIATGAQVNTRNTQGWTPLHIAAAGGDSAVVALLLKHSADVNAQSNIGTTPLYNAMRLSGKRAIIDMLLAHGAQPEDQWTLGC